VKVPSLHHGNNTTNSNVSVILKPCLIISLAYIRRGWYMYLESDYRFDTMETIMSPTYIHFIMDLELNFGTLASLQLKNRYLQRYINEYRFDSNCVLFIHSLSQAVVYSLIHLFSFRPCRGKTAMDLFCTEEMKQLLTSPIIKETKPVTNGTTNQQAVDSGIHSDALYIQ